MSVTTQSPVEWYRAFGAHPGFQPDSAQQHAVQHLQHLYDELLAFKNFRQRPFVKTLDLGTPPRGLYLHGGVGRGKSMLMDAFYKHLPYRRKQRAHFHAFMRDTHAALGALKAQTDPLAQVAADVARKVRVLCLDEFHVNDIGDAMILGRLLENLIALGVVMVTTSNYAPRELYRDGLQRERFIPVITFIEQRLEIVSVDGPTDYRLRQLEGMATYHHPADAAAEAQLSATFELLAGEAERKSAIVVNDRAIAVKRLARNAVWFDFAELCRTARSQIDYLEIARRYANVFVSRVPRMSGEQASEARRFTWLVDILYEHRVKLMISAAVAPPDLYTAGVRSAEFQRTVSRLAEMQGREYLSLSHMG